MNRVTINGKIFTSSGQSIVVNNDKIIVDGKRIGFDDNDKTINIEIHGDVEKLDVEVCDIVNVEGNVGDIRTSQGSITVKGDAMDTVTNSQGSIKIEGDVNGDVKNSMGSVKAGGSIYGKVKTSMGSIKGEKIYVEK